MTERHRDYYLGEEARPLMPVMMAPMRERGGPAEYEYEPEYPPQPYQGGGGRSAPVTPRGQSQFRQPPPGGYDYHEGNNYDSY